MPLDPQRLSPSASLNRVKMVELPTIGLEGEVQGRTAYDLLSLDALMEQLVRHADALGLAATDQADRTYLPLAFDRCFEADEPGIRDAADAIAQRFGRHLGYLIAILKRGDGANRRARVDWDDSYWAYWSCIRQVYLGGGLVSGHFGRRVRHYAEAVVTTAGVVDCRIDVAAYPSILPLIGAARSVPAGRQAALVFDFGQSYLKRAYAEYADGTLIALRLLPALPIDATAVQQQGDSPIVQARRLADYMSCLLADSWKEAGASGLAPVPVLVASVAGYVLDNQPVEGQGGPYAQIRLITGNLGRWLADSVDRQVGRVVDVGLIHDGTAAARTYAGAAHTAVIMLGTALGIGFPPPASSIRPLAPDLSIGLI